MWVFGYGSLVWKADFPYEKKLVGYIKGYVRRFYQKSPDHRGVPNRPGRVTTLIPSDNPHDEVWGLAYKIAAQDIKNVVNHLDFRERHGYIRKTVLFYPCNPPNCIDQKKLLSDISIDSNLLLPVAPTLSEQKPFCLTIYIGEENNPNFAGNEDVDTLARTIIKAAGVSGDNKEYLYKLAAAMRIIAPTVYDEHLFALEEAVKKLEENEKWENLNSQEHICNNEYD